MREGTVDRRPGGRGEAPAGPRPRRAVGALALGAAVLLAGASPAAAAGEPLELLFFSRVPLYHRDDSGSVTGLVASRVARALGWAGIAYRWRELPANRHLREVREAERPVCAVGWFWTPQRARLAKYTRAVYRDRPLIALARTDEGFRARYASVGQVMRRHDRLLGVRSGFSYGAYLDERMAEARPPRYETTRPMRHLVEMLRRRRVDYLFLSPEEADALVPEPAAAGLMRITFDDMPAGNERHLVCSRATPDALIERIDAALERAGDG